MKKTMLKVGIATSILLTASAMMSTNDSNQQSFMDTIQSIGTNPVLAASQLNLSDVTSFKKEIQFLTGKGIIMGFPDGTFKPTESIKRVDAVRMILREKEITNFQAKNPGFQDLKPGMRGYAEVAKAVEVGFISGKVKADGTKYFDANSTLTRAEMAKILVDAYGLKKDNQLTFKDVGANHWSKPFISRLATSGVTVGYDDGTFKPQDNLQRQHFAAFMARLLEPATYNPANKQPVTASKPTPIAVPKDKVTRYDVTLDEMAEIQFKLNGQTDAYRSLPAYIEKAAVQKKDKGGKVLKRSNVVSSDTKHIYGTLANNANVSILNETKTHYQISYQSWRNAKKEDILTNLEPSRFQKGTASYYQFLDLSVTANVTASELNKVLKGKGILENKGSAFVEAGRKHGVNEVYLVSHALLETGQGKSELARGIAVSNVNGKKVTPKKVYNMFGIGARDEDAIRLGSERAYTEGWTTPEKAIVGGAKYIGEAYVNNATYKQNTLYKMRWNPEHPGRHQYATDIGWAVKQTKSIDALYKGLNNYTLTFDVPAYR